MDLIPIEKAKEMFLKYLRASGDTDKAIVYALLSVEDFIANGKDVSYWEEVKAELEII